MNDFLRRIRRLRKQIQADELPMVTLIYSDGTERAMDGMEAFREICTNKAVVKARCQNEQDQSFFEALGPGFDCAELWSDQTTFEAARTESEQRENRKGVGL